jgi:hypothetical protein
MALGAAVDFPGLKIQNWDVAFTDNGPVLVELNTESPMHIWQYASQKPFINKDLADMLGMPANTLQR